MGNFIGYSGDTHSLAVKFIDDYKDDWAFVVERVSTGRQLNCQSYLDEANRIIAPLIELNGYGFGGKIEVARELWRMLRDQTKPVLKPEDEIIYDLPF